MARPNWEYIRIDVLLMENAKVEQLSDRAFRALIDLWCYCGRNSTDGAVTDRRWKAIPPKARTELLSAGLADQAEDGRIVMHDYLEHQRSRDDIRAMSESRSAAGKRGAESRWGSRGDGKSHGKPDGKSHGTPQEQPDGKTMAEAEAEAKKEDPPAPSARPPRGATATRLPPDFGVTTDLAAWAAENVPGFDCHTETLRFRDYWASAPGAKGRKADWKATWRNWMRRAYEDAVRHNGGRPPSRQQETDELFGAAMQRARAREEAGNDPYGNGNAGAFRQGALPPAADRLLHARRLARSAGPPGAGGMPRRRRRVRPPQAVRRPRRDHRRARRPRGGG